MSKYIPTKNYFAQMNDCNPEVHRAQYFYTQENAEAWLKKQPGGGTIKIRTKKGWKIVKSVKEEAQS